MSRSFKGCSRSTHSQEHREMHACAQLTSFLLIQSWIPRDAAAHSGWGCPHLRQTFLETPSQMQSETGIPSNSTSSQTDNKDWPSQPGRCDGCRGWMHGGKSGRMLAHVLADQEDEIWGSRARLHKPQDLTLTLYTCLLGPMPQRFHSLSKHCTYQPGMVAHTCKHRTWEVEQEIKVILYYILTFFFF